MKKLFLLLLLFSATNALPAQNWAPMAVGMLPDNVVIFSISAVGQDVVWAIASEEYYQAWHKTCQVLRFRQTTATVGRSAHSPGTTQNGVEFAIPGL